MIKEAEKNIKRRKDVKTEFFLWDVEELTFLKRSKEGGIEREL
jgi:hypothetical protein